MQSYLDKNILLFHIDLINVFSVFNLAILGLNLDIFKSKINDISIF